MKRSTRKRLLAMLLTLVLTVGEFGMSGSSVYAAALDDSDIISDIISDDAVSVTDTAGEYDTVTAAEDMTDEDGDVLSDVPETYDAEVSGLSQDDSVFSLDKEPSEDVGDETPDKSGDNETSEEDEDVDETEGEGPDEETDEVCNMGVSNDKQVPYDKDLSKISLGVGALEEGYNTSEHATVFWAGQQWRVIGYNGAGVASEPGTVTLITNSRIIDHTLFNYTRSNAYADSELSHKVDEIYTYNFLDYEQDAVKGRTLEIDGYYTKRPYCDGINGKKVENAKLWPLSTEEFACLDESFIGKYVGCWTRSPGRDGHSAAYIGKDNNYDPNYIKYYGSMVSEFYGDCAPAFLLGASSVVYAENRWGHVYSLALLDNKMSIGLSKKATVQDSCVCINYSITGDNASEADAVSVLILDKPYSGQNTNGANVKYYDKLNISGDFSTEGQGTFILPSEFDLDGWGSSYYVYIMAENEFDRESRVIDFSDGVSRPLAITASDLIVKDVVVRFDANGHGTAPAEQKIIKGEKASEPKEPTESGYIFKGWYDNEGCTGSKYTFNEAVTGNLTLYAKWLKLHKVSFDLNGKIGTTSKDQMVEDGGSAVKPDPNPQAKGFYFIGWYENQECTGNMYSFSSPVTKDITLYALWNPVSNIEVKFDLNGKEGKAPSTQYVKYGEKARKPTDPYCTEGWEFLDWYTTSECTGMPFDFDEDTLTADTKLYAGWTNRLNLWVNGVQVAEWNLNTDDYSYDVSTHTLEFKDITFDKTTGYSVGLYKSYVYAEGIDLKVTGKAKTSDSAEQYILNTGIYVNGGDLTIDADLTVSGTGIGLYADNILVEGGKVNIDSDVAAAKVGSVGYRPYGMFARDKIQIDDGTVSINMNGQGATGIMVSDGDLEIKSGSFIAKGNETKRAELFYLDKGRSIINNLYIVQPVGGKLDISERFFVDALGDKAYEVELSKEDNLMRTVTFDLNGKPGTTPAAQTLMKGKKASRPEDPATKGFKGWYTKADCRDEDRFSFNTPITDNITLYAGWKEAVVSKYTVSFDLNGHGTPIADATVEEGEKLSEPADPTESGFVFKGWYLDAECSDGAKYDFNDKVYSDLILYAKWKKTEKYSAEFNLNGHGDPIPSQSVNEGGTVTKPENPSASGFIFKGWYLDPECTVPYDFNSKVYSDVIIYAKWVKNGDTVYTVTFDMGGYGKSIPAQVVGKGKKPMQPVDPVDDTNTMVFAGWFTDSGFASDFYFNKAVTGDTTVYAKWEAIDPNGFFAYFDVKNDTLTYNSGSGRFEHIYTGSKITPKVIVEDCGGNILKDGIDYSIKYNNNQNVDRKGKPAKVTITGKGRYKNSKNLLFYILPKSLGNGLDATPASGIYMYDIILTSGSKAAPVIYYKGYKLVNKDFELKSKTGNIKFTDADLDGNRKLSIYGKGNFSGCIFEAPVTIVSRDEMKAKTINVSLSGVNCVYDGKPQKLTEGQLVVKDGNKNILATDKYDVVYTDNINAGTAKVTVSGKNGYAGTAVKTFKISPDRNISNMGAVPITGNVYFSPEGSGPDLKVTATRDSVTKTLKEGKDYKVTYSNNKKVTDKAKYTVSFMGNYQGQKSIGGIYETKAASFDSSHLKVCAADLIYKNPGKYVSAPYVMYDGVLLNRNDYTVIYKVGEQDITNAKFTLTGTSASVDVILKGKGNYTDTEVPINGCYSIRTEPAGAIDLSKAKITMKDNMNKKIPDQEYTGKELTPEFDIYVKSGNTWKKAADANLVLDTDYKVTYINNKEKGNATILVDAVSTSTKCFKNKTEKFKINPRNFVGLRQLLKL